MWAPFCDKYAPKRDEILAPVDPILEKYFSNLSQKDRVKVFFDWLIVSIEIKWIKLKVWLGRIFK